VIYVLEENSNFHTNKKSRHIECLLFLINFESKTFWTYNISYVYEESKAQRGEGDSPGKMEYMKSYLKENEMKDARIVWDGTDPQAMEICKNFS
jgi:hypothetical protein